LAAEGYTSFGDREGCGERFFAKGPDECRTVYLHVVRLESSNWRDYLKFRDALRRDAKLRDEYACLKREAAVLHPRDRKAYSALKDAWIARVLRS